MADLIFHHFDTSPFSEKVRLVFGFKQLTWKSVKVPVMLPKADVVALTGGYRRTPVGLSTREVVLERRDERAGTVHVHFPRIGYQIKKAS